MTVVTFVVSFVVVGRAGVAIAGTLSCSVTTSCPSGTVIWRMSGTTNAHAELPSGSSYSNLVCCSGVSGLGSSCSGSFAAALGLSGTTNAHAEEGTLGAYGQQACLSVTSGSVSVGYQSASCTGYDTTLGSISATTNAHVGDGSAYDLKVCATASAGGSISTDIVDESYASVTSPTVVMESTDVSYSCQTATGTFGTASQQLYVSNASGANNGWTLTMAAAVSTDLFDGATADYDFNDSGGLGCADGTDADSVGGQMTVDPSVATLSVGSCATCTTAHISKGSSSSFVEGLTDSITLLTAAPPSDNTGDWTMRGVSVSQKIPAEQPAGSDYQIHMVLTVTAS